MKEALQRAMAAKLAADAKTKTLAPAKAAAPAVANAVTHAKHWAARDYPAPVPAVKTPTNKAKTRHVVSVPGRTSYDK